MGFIIRVKVEYEHNGARLRAQEALMEVSCTAFHNVSGSIILINCSL